MTMNELTNAWECVPRRGIPNNLPAATLLWQTPKHRYKVDGLQATIFMIGISGKKKGYKRKNYLHTHKKKTFTSFAV